MKNVCERKENEVRTQREHDDLTCFREREQSLQQSRLSSRDEKRHLSGTAWKAREEIGDRDQVDQLRCADASLDLRTREPQVAEARMIKSLEALDEVMWRSMRN